MLNFVMLSERPARGIVYDAVTDVSRVFVEEPPGTVRTHTALADLLLDAQGFLVGIDIEPDAPGRAIVMVGPHESVARKASARVGVCTDASGGVFEVRIANARAAIRGDQKNPYI
jgi:hypothetical protein